MSMLSKFLGTKTGSTVAGVVGGLVGGAIGGPIIGGLAAKAAQYPARLARDAALRAVSQAAATGAPVPVLEQMNIQGVTSSRVIDIAKRAVTSPTVRRVAGEAVQAASGRTITVGGRRTYLQRVLDAADIARNADGSPYLQRRIFSAAMPKRHRGLSYSDLRGFRKTMRLLKSVGRKVR